MTVLIVGAGPTGMALAASLLRDNIPVRIIDAAAGPATSSRALGLLSRGVEVLNRLSALGDLPERGNEIINTTLYLKEKKVGEFGAAAWRKPGEHANVIIAQTEIEAQLRHRLEELGGSIEWQVELTELHQYPGRIIAHTSGGEQIEADWIVGCDGAHSKVRKLLGIGFPGEQVSENFLLADLVVTLPHTEEQSSSCLDAEGMLATFALPGKDQWRFMVDTTLQVEPEDVGAYFEQAFAQRTGRKDIKVHQVTWSSLFRIHRRLADQYRVQRAFLAGDAAHIHSPFGAQGMNTGIGDAENLGWKLAMVIRGQASEELLDSYEAERRPIATEVLANTTFGTKALLATNPVGRFLRDHLVLRIMANSRFQSRLLRGQSQLDVNYRGGPLASGRSLWPGGPRPGDRVPDLACTREDGTPVKLHTELQGRWALVLGQNQPRLQLDWLGDQLITLQGRQPDTIMVRPDAHLAWRENHSISHPGEWIASGPFNPGILTTK